MENQLDIIREIINDPQISIVELSQRIGISSTAVENNITKFKDKGILKRIGPAKGGYWEVDQELATFLKENLIPDRGLGEKLGEKLGENQLDIIREIINDPQISIVELSQRIGISSTAIENNITKLKEKNVLKRIGPDRGGYWEVDPELAKTLNKK